MDTLLVPEEVRQRLGDTGSDGLVTMFADAHRIAAERFERSVAQVEARMDERFAAVEARMDHRFAAVEARMDHRFELFEERFERRLAHELGVLRFDLLKWSFLFWIGQLAALTAILSAITPR